MEAAVQVRSVMYRSLGCEECADIYERCRSFAPACYRATSAVLCSAADAQVRAERSAGVNESAAVDFGMLGGFEFDDGDSLSDELVSVSQVSGVLTPEEAALALEAASGAAGAAAVPVAAAAVAAALLLL